MLDGTTTLDGWDLDGLDLDAADAARRRTTVDRTLTGRSPLATGRGQGAGRRR